MLNFSDYFNNMNLDVITTMSDAEFDGYTAEIQDQLKETLNSPEFDAEIRESLLSKDNNSYLIIKEVDESIEQIAEGLTSFSEKKQKFIMDLYMSICNTIKRIANEGRMVREIPMHISYLHPDAQQPEYAHHTDAAADLYSTEEVIVMPFSKDKVPTGIAIAVPHGYVAEVNLRSGISLKTPLILSNGTGLIDAGYRDEIFVLITNTSDKPYTIEKGTRLGQISIHEMIHINWLPCDNVHDIGEDRGGGLGSTGVK